MDRITKRQIGVAIVALSVLAIVGMLALNVVRGEARGIGPAQKLALLACAAFSMLAVPLIIWGKQPITGDSASRLPHEKDHPARGGEVIPLQLAQRIVIGITAMLMLGHLIVFVVYGLSLARFPFDYDQGEGFELNDTILLSQGQSPYRSNEEYPFYASNYPPLYHVILVPFVWLFGPQYWYGRLAGLAATLVAAGAITYAVNRETQHRMMAVISGLAFVASNYIYHIGPLFRQHMSMVTLETLAVVVIAGITASDSIRHSRRKLIGGLLLLLAAGYTKQLAIVTAGAIFVYLFLRDPRRAITWGVGFGAIGGAIFLAINIATGGQWWLNTITANVNQYILSQFMGLFRQFVGLHGAILILAVALVLYEIYMDRVSLYTIWFLAAAAGSIFAGKWGAGDSYFSTLIAATCILAGIFAGRCLNRSWRLPRGLSVRFEALIPLLTTTLTPILGVVACVLFIVYGLAAIHLPLDGPLFGPLAHALNLQSNTKFANFYDSAGWTMGYATIGQIPTAADTDNGWRIVAAIKAAGQPEKPILSEEAAFSFHTGKPVVSNPTQLLNLYQNGHYDPTNLIKMIDAQAFSVVIFRAAFYPEAVLVAVARAYKDQQTISMNGYEYTIKLPNPEWKGQPDPAPK